MALNLRRPIELYKYFPFKTATALTICESARALFDPYRHSSYSQCGEDRIIISYLNPARTGFYVDVGCNHPIRGSNTLTLYSRGWRGVVVDGNPELITHFKRVRPRDTVICAVISDEEHPAEFIIAKDSLLSTVSSEFARNYIGQAGVKHRSVVDTVRLQKVMEETKVPAKFELLSIDVEGHDYEVLTSFDIRAFRPRIIIIEMDGFVPANYTTNLICRYLEQNQYQLRSYTDLNGIFVVRQEPQDIH